MPTARLVAANFTKIIAVFDIESKRGVGVSAARLQDLTDYLATNLAAGGYQVIPRQTIRQRLLDEKRDSYRECYDQKCQIELGKELAAQGIVTTRIVPLGGKCQVSATLYDLKLVATEIAAVIEVSCDERGFLNAIRDVSARLCGRKVEPPPVEQSAPDTNRSLRGEDRTAPNMGGAVPSDSRAVAQAGPEVVSMSRQMIIGSVALYLAKCYSGVARMIDPYGVTVTRDGKLQRVRKLPEAMKQPLCPGNRTLENLGPRFEYYDLGAFKPGGKAEVLGRALGMITEETCACLQYTTSDHDPIQDGDSFTCHAWTDLDGDGQLAHWTMSGSYVGIAKEFRMQRFNRDATSDDW